MKPREEADADVAERGAVAGGGMSTGSAGSVGSAGSGSDSDSGSDSGSERERAALEAELSLEDRGAPARALAALNALRKSRQHFDVVLVAGGAEVAAHRALLAAASPLLLRDLGPDAGHIYRVDVDADALRALVDYVYTGRLVVRDTAGARRLYAAAAALRVEAARAHLAERLVRRLAPQHCLLVRALPALQPHHLQAIDAYIAEHFDEVCATGALGSLPLVRIEILRATSADGGEESPGAVAAAALAWLRDHNETASLEELCARTHLVFVDAAGSLRDCEQLPASSGDALELTEYRRAAARRRLAPPPAALRLSPDTAVLAARGAGSSTSSSTSTSTSTSAPRDECRVTRALLALGGRLAAARVAWRELAGGAGAVGGPLGGGGAREAGERRAELGAGRAALGGAALAGALLVCGGYDRAQVHRAAQRYSPARNAWSALPDMRGPRARFPAARLGRKLYVLGGSDGHNELDTMDVLEEVEITTPSTPSSIEPAESTQLAAEPQADATESSWRWRAAGRLPAAVSHAAGAAHEQARALYVVGGWAGGRSLRRVHKYLPDDELWLDAPSLITGRSQAASVVWEGSLWALGGCDAWHCLASTESLPLGEDGAVWQQGPPLPTARRSVGGASWRGRLVSVGGSDGAASLRRVELLATPAGAWAPGPPLRRARAALALADLQGVLYAVGGFDGKEFLSCVECLYSVEGPWTTLCCPPAPPLPPAPLTPPGASPSPSPSPSPTATLCGKRTDRIETTEEPQPQRSNGVVAEAQ